MGYEGLGEILVQFHHRCTLQIMQTIKFFFYLGERETRGKRKERHTYCPREKQGREMSGADGGSMCENLCWVRGTVGWFVILAELFYL